MEQRRLEKETNSCSQYENEFNFGAKLKLNKINDGVMRLIAGKIMYDENTLRKTLTVFYGKNPTVNSPWLKLIP